ncbi:30S ribosomal protein S4 [Candidatus Curtissbacteria bacterium RBG_16_39_7]|uniref:Small ribosomal subunit protein uS4 n=1 Tax=Candidatus Curtissbacteria bacterium RBG_16_39_7 TaxID=1797707 RepID=A0A1F5G1I3_9BACT|nr:MAG: 30S ribosomal protein S4 [Candidatus Curtissbacteria bacterium RBG_16_39_7]
MARYTGPKHKLCRREGIPLCGSVKCPVHTRTNPPGQHGPKGRRRLSAFGQQLREKQKAKRIYGVLERQFRRYVREAQKAKGKTGEVLLQLLETRLDNVLYRMGFAPTRSSSRQLVSHGHVLVDEKKVDIPSYNLKPNQIVTFRDQSLKIPLVQENLSKTKKEKPPTWLEKKGPVGKILRLPEREEIGEPINEQFIVEFYSR